MMRFREALDIIDGLRSVAEEMDILSASGRSCLMETEFLVSKESLEKEYDAIDAAITFLRDESTSGKKNSARSILSQTRHIPATLQRLKDGCVPEEVELFEIKGLAMGAGALSEIFAHTPLGLIASLEIPDLSEVRAILDPEKTGSSHFYIYDAYSEILATRRRELKALQEKEGYDEEESSRLTTECMMLEDEIREEIGIRLKVHADALWSALKAIGRADLTLAKASLAMTRNLGRPALNEEITSYTSLRYLPMAVGMADAGKEFQPVDITLTPGVTMITGTNMGGKTITLKSVGLAQAMAQFGLFVAAGNADIAVVDAIEKSIGDSQTEAEGLSSFGAEIKRLDTIIRKASEGRRMLVLIDEPARTTNPEEGASIADAVASLLQRTSCLTLMTTHYGNLTTPCRRLKVKGLRPGAFATGSEFDALCRYMDYGLEEPEEGDFDREALGVARLLGISPEFSAEIEDRIRNKEQRLKKNNQD